MSVFIFFDLSTFIFHCAMLLWKKNSDFHHKSNGRRVESFIGVGTRYVVPGDVYPSSPVRQYWRNMILPCRRRKHSSIVCLVAAISESIGFYAPSFNHYHHTEFVSPYATMFRPSIQQLEFSSLFIYFFFYRV